MKASKDSHPLPRLCHPLRNLAWWSAVLLIALCPGASSQTTTEDCLDCHDDAEMFADDGRMVGVPTDWFSASVHGELDCVDCHAGPADYEDVPHYEKYAAVRCSECHEDEVHSFTLDTHAAARSAGVDAPTCLGCHARAGNAHRIHDEPTLTAAACAECHQQTRHEFERSVHGALFTSGEMTCISCHRTHLDERQRAGFDVGCGSCHSEVAAGYEQSIHRIGRRQGNTGAASCVDCHSAHLVLSAADSTADTHAYNIPKLCGKCHADEPMMTEDFVRLPVSLPNYLESVHGQGWSHHGENGQNGNRWNRGVTAVCTDCHGVHELRAADDPAAMTHRTNIASTCGACHDDVTAEYQSSIHGKAVALGIKDSPTCTDCHDEHLIKRHEDPDALVSAEHRSRELCGDCHTNPELLSKYGVRAGVLETYLDSYHAWAVDRGSDLVATCTDCHNVHAIRSPLDPKSSVHPANVTETCRQCHEHSNTTFAQSYTHESALVARGAHGWARMIYVWLIAFVLGGMAIHNLIVARYEIKQHVQHRKSEPYVQRWWRAERVQHLVLLLSFSGLALTGFALRFPDSWWVKLIGLGGHESVRANLHRALAVILTAQAIYHMFWVVITRHGRRSIGAMAPRYYDVAQFVQNMTFHLGLRKERPAFRRFDYTQKAEYWAVVWGTLVMALTGAILWFPAIATGWLPAWAVRVSEVVHFYEAILAVSAIFIWHFFYVIFMPSEYPMSTIWLNGRMPAGEWKELHRGEFEEVGGAPVKYPDDGASSGGEQTEATDEAEEAPGDDVLNVTND